MTTLHCYEIDETDLFRASCETSLFDFLKTDIGLDKRIECHFPFDICTAVLTLQLIRKKVKWIRFSNTDKLYPPDFKPNYIAISSPEELTKMLKENILPEHFFCRFNKSELTYEQRATLNQTNVASLSFADGHSIYAPF